MVTVYKEIGLIVDFGDEKCVKFWEDRWVDGLALKENFPRLYSISQNKDSLVGDLAE